MTKSSHIHCCIIRSRLVHGSCISYNLLEHPPPGLKTEPPQYYGGSPDSHNAIVSFQAQALIMYSM